MLLHEPNGAYVCPYFFSMIDDENIQFGTLMDLLTHPQVSYAILTVRTFMLHGYEYAIDQ